MNAQSLMHDLATTLRGHPVGDMKEQIGRLPFEVALFQPGATTPYAVVEAFGYDVQPGLREHTDAEGKHHAAHRPAVRVHCRVPPPPAAPEPKRLPLPVLTPDVDEPSPAFDGTYPMPEGPRTLRITERPAPNSDSG